MTKNNLILIKSAIVSSVFLAPFLPLQFLFAATIDIVPDAPFYSQGDTVTASIYVNSKDKTINAVSGTLTFSSDYLLPVSTSKEGSILTFWTKSPTISKNSISFEGLIFNPGFAGERGLVVEAVFSVQRTGNTALAFSAGSVLANDGQGTNILSSLPKLKLSIKEKKQEIKNTKISTSPAVLASDNTPIPIIPPVIIASSPPIDQSQSFYILGKGVPNALTKIEFQDITEPSIGRKLVRSLITDKVPLTDIEILNDSKGIFSYVSPTNLVAGVFKALPEYINPAKTESIIGQGVTLVIIEDTLHKVLVIIINALVLIIPILALVLIIIFLPWYFKKEVHIISKKMELEEEKIDAEERNLAKNEIHKKRI